MEVRAQASGKTSVVLTKDEWADIGQKAGWMDVGFGLSRFKFTSGPGVHCWCPQCGKLKPSCRLMPCETLTCPECGSRKMVKVYIDKQGRFMEV